MSQPTVFQIAFYAPTIEAQAGALKTYADAVLKAAGSTSATFAPAEAEVVRRVAREADQAMCEIGGRVHNTSSLLRGVADPKVAADALSQTLTYLAVVEAAAVSAGQVARYAQAAAAWFVVNAARTTILNLLPAEDR